MAPNAPVTPLPSWADAEPPHWDLRHIVGALRESREHNHKVRHRGHIREMPSRDVMGEVIKGLSAALFPTHYGRPDLTDESIDYYVGETLNHTLLLLNEQVRRGLLFSLDPDSLQSSGGDLGLREQAQRITQQFAQRLVPVRALLASDLQSAFAGDPAATSISEILLCYPGFTAILHHRLAHELHELGAPVLARLIADIAHSRTGIDIHPGAQIGPAFFIDHGTGVVIGETTVIGRGVRLYQAVTLGAKRFATDESGALVKGNPRHPIVEDEVVIYAGATVLGRITVGAGSTIGGNVWLTHSVPPGSHITQAQNRDTPL
jgi:serine O-acetyltransferase